MKPTYKLPEESKPIQIPFASEKIKVLDVPIPKRGAGIIEGVLELKIINDV